MFQGLKPASLSPCLWLEPRSAMISLDVRQNGKIVDEREVVYTHLRKCFFCGFFEKTDVNDYSLTNIVPLVCIIL